MAELGIDFFGAFEVKVGLRVRPRTSFYVNVRSLAMLEPMLRRNLFMIGEQTSGTCVNVLKRVIDLLKFRCRNGFRFRDIGGTSTISAECVSPIEAFTTKDKLTTCTSGLICVSTA